MIHAAARGEPYACFVRPDYADSVHGDAGRDRRAAEAVERRSRIACHATAYNVRAFNPSADEIRASALRAFPDAPITYKSTRSARPSSIRGPRTSTTRRRAATGILRRPTISIVRFTNT